MSTSTDENPYGMRPGLEPLPGYRLLHPLGRGGFGEVWKCEAPGGLHKAVKFVFADPNASAVQGGAALRQEFEAFQHIKAIRHPFLLTLERVELTDDYLVMVMELADEHLMDRFNACKESGVNGIEREELLRYLADAAEALDFMGFKYGLQHLDVKPANLFIVAGHGKVGDYGLVARQDVQGSAGAQRGLTPRYCAPEVMKGQIDPRSDQYSLALVYHELLTGGFPYQARTVQQMMLQHAMAEPDVSALPEADRQVVRRALAKTPADRFPNCVAFVRALAAAGLAPAAPGWSPAAAPTSPLLSPLTGTPPPVGSRADPFATPQRDGAGGQLRTQSQMRHVPGSGLTSRPRPPAEVVPLAPAPPPPPHAARQWADEPVVRLADIQMVMDSSALVGKLTPAVKPPKAAALIETVVLAALAGSPMPGRAGEVTRRADGAWVCRFPAKPMASVVRLKLDALAEGWEAVVAQPDPTTFVIRRPVEAGGWFAKKKGSLEVTLRIPDPAAAVGEFEAVGRAVGQVEPVAAEQALPLMLDGLRTQFQNMDDRRRAVRVPFAGRLTVYPIRRDGVLAPVAARGQNMSHGGICFTADGPVETTYGFLLFDDLPSIAGWALLTRFLRRQPVGNRVVLAGRFRTDPT